MNTLEFARKWVSYMNYDGRDERDRLIEEMETELVQLLEEAVANRDIRRDEKKRKKSKNQKKKEERVRRTQTEQTRSIFQQ